MVYYVLGKNKACPFLYYYMQDGYSIMKTNKKIFGLSAALPAGLFLGALRALIFPYGEEPVLYYAAVSAAAALLAFFSISAKPSDAPLRHENSDIFKTAIVFASLLSIAAACLRAYAFVGAPINVISLVCTALLLISGVGMITSVSKGVDGETSAVMASVPIFFTGVYLLDSYRNIAAASAVIRTYAVELLAVVFLLLGTYFAAHMRFKNRSSGFNICFSVLMAVFFTALCLGSFICSLPLSPYPFGITDILTTTALAVYCAAWFVYPPEKYVEPSDDDTEDDDDPEGAFAPDSDGYVPTIDEIIEENRK